MEKNNNYGSINYEQIEKLIPTQVTQLRLELQDKHNLVIPEQCSEFLARCLRLKDGNLEKAVKLIKAFHVTIRNFRDWDAVFLPSVLQQLCKDGPTIFPAKHRDSKGRLILILRIELWNPKEMNFDQAMVSLWMAAQYVSMVFPDVQRNGFVTYWDFTNFSLEQAWALNKWRILSLARWAQNGVLCRLKEFHAIHTPTVLRLIYKAAKPLLKDKMKKRINLHDSVDSLLKHVDANYLPSYMGGTLEPNECSDNPLVEQFFNDDQYFQDMMKYGLPTK